MIDFEELKENLVYKIINMDISEYPYPHYAIQDVFPAEVYELIVKYWPECSQFQPINETERIVGYSSGQLSSSGKNRLIISYKKENLESFTNLDSAYFWSRLRRVLDSAEMITALLQRTMKYVQAGRPVENNLKLKSDIIFVQDRKGYFINPHTDAPMRYVTTLFYCPDRDDITHLGSSIYIPKDKVGFPYQISSVHLPREQFTKIITAPYVPNTLFGFVVGPKSFHGRDLIVDENIERRIILHMLKKGPTR